MLLVAIQNSKSYRVLTRTLKPRSYNYKYGGLRGEGTEC